MTALEYMKGFNLIFPPKTEEEALEFLIRSHKSQRELVHEIMTLNNERNKNLFNRLKYLITGK